MTDSTTSGTGAAMILILLVGLLSAGVSVYAIMRIAGKAGFNPALGLLSLIPGVGGILLIVFAFIRWPIEGQQSAPAAGGGAQFPPPGAGQYGAGSYGRPPQAPSAPGPYGAPGYGPHLQGPAPYQAPGQYGVPSYGPVPQSLGVPAPFTPPTVAPAQPGAYGSPDQV